MAKKKLKLLDGQRGNIIPVGTWPTHGATFTGDQDEIEFNVCSENLLSQTKNDSKKKHLHIPTKGRERNKQELLVFFCFFVILFETSNSTKYKINKSSDA